MIIVLAIAAYMQCYAHCMLSAEVTRLRDEISDGTGGTGTIYGRERDMPEE